MNSKAEAASSSADTVKLIIALLLLIGAIGAFYYFAEQSLLLRVVGLLAVAGIATAIALQTDRGRGISAFFKATQVEVRKVVWPTRQETVQTTLIVFGMVVLVAIFMWLLDLLLGWAVSGLVGTGV